MDNMSIYNAARSVPKEAQKSFNNGSFSGTDINPMWRLKKLTELFGPCGIGWYIEVTKQEMIPIDDEIISNVNIALYIKDGDHWSAPIFGTGANKFRSKTKSGTRVSDEGYKMAYTDAISVACKALGIGADIYLAGDKSSKYSPYYTESYPTARPRLDQHTKRADHLRTISTEEQVEWMLKKFNVTALDDLTDEQIETMISKIEARERKQA